MSPDVTTSFLTYYIRSLGERTRAEKTSTKFGFDWIIYNLALADSLTPYRLPFIRSGATEISKTKTEPELGIDSSFLSPDRQSLTIFVLKDEVLSNSNWTANDFDADLRKAAAPDLTPPEFKEIKKVRIVLAYNKDEDQTGIKLYNNLTSTLGSRIADNVELSFERWNLTTLTEQVRSKLLTPSLLPQQFFSHFSYICSQFGDFRHGSDEWTKQLIPNWRRFLEDLVKENADERSVRLLPVALIILREHGKSNPSAETGWIDLSEWAIIAAWRVHQATEKRNIKEAVFQMWVGFYLVELARFYQEHSEELAIEHSLEAPSVGNYIDSVAVAVVAFWHIARLGILGMSYAELLEATDDEQSKLKTDALRQTANWLVSLLNANPAANRPLLDLHHIELFLIWRTLWQLGRTDDIFKWLHTLRSHLLVRRVGAVPIPFIEGGNSLDLVFEHVATGEKPPEFSDQSSLLVLSILELCFGLEPAKRNELLAAYYQQIVLGQDSYGERLKDRQPLDLMGWSPPEDWGQKVLVKSLADEGESQTVELLNTSPGSDGSVIAECIETFVQQSRSSRKTQFPAGLPAPVVILACLKLRSPLPPEFWRLPIFGPVKAQPKPEAVTVSH
jgi:hypothetical protein